MSVSGGIAIEVLVSESIEKEECMGRRDKVEMYMQSEWVNRLESTRKECIRVNVSCGTKHLINE